MRRRSSRLAKTVVVLMLLCVGMGVVWWFECWPDFGLESDGLNLGLYHRLAKYRIPWSGLYFDRFGFSLGCGWLGGMETGKGNFMYRHWVLVVPYWFCGVVFAVLAGLIVGRVRRWRRGRASWRSSAV